jgi:SAM-dependent methyltransferase
MRANQTVSLTQDLASTAPGLGSDNVAVHDIRCDARWLTTVRKLRHSISVRDCDWDLGYPRRYAELSPIHWTPITVTRRAAGLLSRGSSSRILDVGSGVGKFCMIAALTTPGVFVGVERCGEMVDVASEVARRARVATARFIHARAEDIDWSNFDGFYFFNPYADLQCSRDMCFQPGGANALDYRRSVAFTKQA